MAEKETNAELTSTIHLGSRSENVKPIASSDGSHLDESLSALAEDEREVIQGIASGDGMLIIHRGPSKGARYLLNGSDSEIRVGRAPESEVFLDDVTVSRKHASITYEGSSFHFKDLGSLNGTYINGVAKSDVSLKSGDEIQIGKFHMLFFGGNQ